MATNTAVANLNRVQYAGLDFPTIFDDLRSELQTKFAGEFNDFALSSLAIMLTDLSAYGLDTLSFYLDRRASDAYLETAQTRKAVARLARQLGYKMGGAVSSSTDLSVRVTNAVNFLVTIPQGFQFKGPNGLIFEVAQGVTIAPLTVAAVAVPVYEGETIAETFIGNGQPNQVFQLSSVPAGKSVVQGSAKVLVNGATFAEAEFLPITGGQYFELGYNDDPATVRFGDGTVSQTDIPAQGATISVSYIASSGQAGQVSANTITSVVTPLVINTVTVPLTVTNPEAAVGGDNPESLERTKVLAPQVYKSRQVAITQSDYVALSTAFADPLFGRVAVAQAYSTRSANSDLELQSLLQDVRDTISPVKAAVDAQVVALGVQTEAITLALADITTANADIVTQRGIINNIVDSTTGTAVTNLQAAANTTTVSTSRCVSGTTATSLIPAATGVTTQTTASFVQPAPLNDVTVFVSDIANLTIGQTVTVSTGGALTGGTYTVKTVPTTTSVLLTLVTAGPTTPAGTVVASGSELSSTPTDALTNATQTLLQSLFSDIYTDLGSISSNVRSAITSIGNVEAANDLILAGTGSITTSVGTAQAAVNVVNGTVSPAITAAVVPLSVTGTATGTVNLDLAAIADHVDGILSANCSANLVTVPILTKDADGFYVGPSVGLKNSLQSYLDARKSVTQSVVVTSGAQAIVKAVISLQVGVLQGFSEQVVAASVTSAMNGLLKSRLFGVSLYRSDIVQIVQAVEGVSFVNPIITGYLDPLTPSVTLTDKIDAFGNLIINKEEVVSKGSISISTVVRTSP
jgi:hypothetical protein